ncbi:MAG TPA: crotonase/enoyl-CoA hydratase family protein [Acidimicrobiales bacterium]|nr:crotonase/enoyl-CoA hydratase family protein [Acidimicrobiales bacterium]
MSDAVVYTVIDGVADVRLNRPDKLNAVNQAMFAGLGDTADALAADPSVRAVVLSGEGGGFCAGLDFSSFQSMAGGDGLRDDSGEQFVPSRKGEGGLANSGQWAAYAWTALPVPVIAAVHGPAVGAGFQIAIACDIRIVAPDAKLSVLEIRWGLIPDMSGTQMLPRLVGLDVAKELTYTGRMVSGVEAKELGLATRVSDNPREDALELARQIASKNPHAIRGAKKLLNMAGQVPLADGLKAEERTMGSLIGSPNNVEAVTAYFEKRDPKFTDVEK